MKIQTNFFSTNNTSIKIINFNEVKNGCEIVEKNLNTLIAPIYGNQAKALDKIKNNRDRICEILFYNNEDVGLLIYKKSLVNEYKDQVIENSLEIKTLMLTKPEKYSGKNLATKLLNRIKEIASNLNAKNIIVTVSSIKPESLLFFLKKGFSILKCYKDLYIKGNDEYLLTNFNFDFEPSNKNDEANVNEHPGCLKNFIDLRQNNLNFELNNNIAFHLLKYQEKKLKNHYALFYPMLTYYNFVNPHLHLSINIELILGIDYFGNTDIIALYLNNKDLQNYWNYLISLLKFKNVKNVDIICYTKNNRQSIDALKKAFPNSKCEKIELYVHQNLQKHLKFIDSTTLEDYLYNLINYNSEMRQDSIFASLKSSKSIF